MYIGAENIISPLGNTAEANFSAIEKGMSALVHHSHIFENGQEGIAGLVQDFKAISNHTKLESLMIYCLKGSLAQINTLDHSRTIIIWSTTKGDIDFLKSNDLEKAKPTYLLHRVKSYLCLQMDIRIVSNACISGVLAIIYGNDLIATGQYDHAIVIGSDLVSEFTYKGFESFFALSKIPCKPFDRNRTGLSLGEGVASVVLSSKKETFSNPILFKGGATANDANHISGPSRTGEGLYRAIQKCLKHSNTDPQSIDFISAHGTATLYNDDMESIALKRLQLEKKPVNSFKGYFGHTLGAAGVLEIALSMQSMKNDTMIKSAGFEETGTTEAINVIDQNKSAKIKTVLKTASGFGGCNSAVILTTAEA